MLGLLIAQQYLPGSCEQKSCTKYMQSLLNSFCVKSFTQLHVLISVGFGLWPDSYILQIKESENRVCQKQPSIDAST